MKSVNGNSVCLGVVIGKIQFYRKNAHEISKVILEDIEGEKNRYLAARDKAIQELKELYENTKTSLGEDAEIFEMHGMLLEDEDYNDEVLNIIDREHTNAEYAVFQAGEHFYDIFSNIEDEYMKNRAIDMRHISEKVILSLQGLHQVTQLKEPRILAADDLQPSETVQLDRNMLLAFVTKKGSSNSHTAILARTMNIPALVNVDIDKGWDGKLAIVDANTGCMIIEPDEKTIEKYQRIIDEQTKQDDMLQELKGKESVTQNGHKVKLYANIGNLTDLNYVIENDAEGVGLFRSEFIYLNSNDYPTEEQSFEIYKKAAEALGQKRLIIRTLDIGADKKVDYFNLDEEENPALGYRAIRICLKRPEIFKTQLRAILRASIYGNISIMYPMITSVEEITSIKTIVNEVRAELDAEKIPSKKDIEQGIMIETPAAAIISDVLAKEVDFFSIGTNDLSQYTLAIDRMNDKLEDFFDSHHEAILRLIELTVKNAHNNGIWVGICGELGSDTSLTQKFMDMGIDELSVSSSKVLKVRQIIRSCK